MVPSLYTDIFPVDNSKRIDTDEQNDDAILNPANGMNYHCQEDDIENDSADEQSNSLILNPANENEMYDRYQEHEIEDDGADEQNSRPILNRANEDEMYDHYREDAIENVGADEQNNSLVLNPANEPIPSSSALNLMLKINPLQHELLIDEQDIQSARNGGRMYWPAICAFIGPVITGLCLQTLSHTNSWIVPSIVEGLNWCYISRAVTELS